MPALPLTLIKQHLVVDHSDDDQLLTHYSGVAEVWIVLNTGQPFDAANSLMVQAALLLVGHMYEQREPIAFSNPYAVPFGVHDLLAPLKERVVGYIRPTTASAAPRAIVSTSYDATTGRITLTFSDGTTFQTGDLRGADGADGADGQSVDIQTFETLAEASAYSAANPDALVFSGEATD